MTDQPPGPAGGVGPPLTLYKYKVGLFQNHDIEAMEQMLNDYGAGGWQLGQLAWVGEHRMIAVMVMEVSSIDLGAEPAEQDWSEVDDIVREQRDAEQTGTEIETETTPEEYEMAGRSAEVEYAEEPEEPPHRHVHTAAKPKRQVKRKK